MLFGCANPGIVQISQNTYMLAKADKAGIFGNAAKLKANVITEANEFAESKGKVAIPLTSKETPVAPGRFATFEYQFKLVEKDSPEALEAHLVPRADFVVEKNEKIEADITNRDASDKKEDLYTELMKLNDLKEKGILSEEEFKKEKEKLLNK